MLVKVILRFTTFADYPRFEYILVTTGVLNNLYLGTTFQEAVDSMTELNDNRKALGLSELIVDFVN